MKTRWSDKAQRVLSKGHWTLADALAVGLISLCLFAGGIILQFAAQYEIHFAPSLTDFQKTLISQLLVLVPLGGIGGAVIARFAKLRGIHDLWESICWNPHGHIATAALIGFSLAGLLTPVFGKVLARPVWWNDAFRLLSVILYLVVVALLQPLIEEFYFRGLLFVTLEQRIGGFATVAVTALLFTLLHPLERMAILPVGFVLGITRLKTKSVASSFALHAGYNLGVLIFRGPYFR